MFNLGFSKTSLKLRDSITHGTKAKIAELNRGTGDRNQVIDLSIGTLDEIADPRIDQGVIEFIQNKPAMLHDFAPVVGFDFLLKAISDRVFRLRGIRYSPEREIMVTPGGIKGSITVVFHTFLDPDDEVIVPVPNWPHYADMIELHGAVMKEIFIPECREKGLSPKALEAAINQNTKMVILGDCINPCGKIYSLDELSALSLVIAKHNVARVAKGQSPIHVLFDCPYESHILNQSPASISAVEVKLDDGTVYSMRNCTTIVTGPGKTYGMHGDRIGYICTSELFLPMMAKVQVNLNSFASTYSQVATYTALQSDMDNVAHWRAVNARKNLQGFLEHLNAVPKVRAPLPEGGYFVFVDLSNYGEQIERAGYATADKFILEKARVASIGGQHFAQNITQMRYFIRLNCGRSEAYLTEAANRIADALATFS